MDDSEIMTVLRSAKYLALSPVEKIFLLGLYFEYGKCENFTIDQEAISARIGKQWSRRQFIQHVNDLCDEKFLVFSGDEWQTTKIKYKRTFKFAKSVN